MKARFAAIICVMAVLAGSASVLANPSFDAGTLRTPSDGPTVRLAADPGSPPAFVSGNERHNLHPVLLRRVTVPGSAAAPETRALHGAPVRLESSGQRLILPAASTSLFMCHCQLNV